MIYHQSELVKSAISRKHVIRDGCAPVLLRLPLEPLLYGSLRYRPGTHPDGFKQPDRLPLHFAYNGWSLDKVASRKRNRHGFRIQF